MLHQRMLDRTCELYLYGRTRWDWRKGTNEVRAISRGATTTAQRHRYASTQPNSYITLYKQIPNQFNFQNQKIQNQIQKLTISFWVLFSAANKKWFTTLTCISRAAFRLLFQI